MTHADRPMKTILIVDDELFMRRLLEQTLRKSGARLATATSGDEALAWLETDAADLLVIDVTMPGRDGFETVRALRADGRHGALPVIMLTAGGLGDVRQRAAELGVAAFFTKPFSPAGLAEKTAQLLRDPA
jgi:two-component system chemotaxis response regulator CheY